MIGHDWTFLFCYMILFLKEKFMKSSKIDINQITSPKGNTFLVLSFDDKNTHKNFEIYQLVQNASEIAKDEFDVSECVENRESKLNTREMWEIILKSHS